MNSVAERSPIANNVIGKKTKAIPAAVFFLIDSFVDESSALNVLNKIAKKNKIEAIQSETR